MALPGFTDYGFPGTMGDSAAWSALQEAFGVDDSFPSYSRMRPTVVSGATRTVRVSAGESSARGVRSLMEANHTRVLGDQASGVRYDCIVIERVQGADAPSTGSRIAVVSTSSRSIPALTRDPMGVWQTPIALVRVASSPTGATITELVDLRVLRLHGGVFTVMDDLALSMIQQPGIIAHNASTKSTVVAVYGTSGTIRWLPMMTSDTPSESVSFLASSGSGFTSANTSRTSRLVSEGRKRSMFLEMKRTSSSLITAGSDGNVGNVTLATLKSEDWPLTDVPVTMKYLTPGGADLSGLVTVLTNGEIELNSLLPNTSIRSGQTGSGLWSVQMKADWYTGA